MLPPQESTGNKCLFAPRFAKMFSPEQLPITGIETKNDSGDNFSQKTIFFSHENVLRTPIKREIKNWGHFSGFAAKKNEFRKCLEK